jgi:hypothetical protein
MFRARLLGGVEAMAKTKIPAAKTYELAWVSPRRAGGTAKVRFSFNTDPVSANPSGDPPLRPAKKVVDSLKNDGLKKSRRRSALIP